MKRPYFTLVTRTEGVWYPQFGDYDREVVEAERDDMLGRNPDAPKRKDTKIITTGVRKAEVDAAIAKLNAKSRLLTATDEARFAAHGPRK